MKKIMRLGFVFALMVIMSMISGPAATGQGRDRTPIARDSNATAVTGPWYIVSRNSGRCVNVRGGSTANGAQIIQYDCVTALNNLWYLDGPYGDGYYYIVSANSDRCLNVQGGSTANGAAIIQYDCVAAWNNVWYLEGPFDGYYYIVSANSFRCVNVRGGSTANGAEIIQYDCVNAYNNHWRFA
jgi:endoglucanase